MVLDSDYLMVIRFFTPFTPFTSLASLAAGSNSATLLALPYNVTTPLFVSTTDFTLSICLIFAIISSSALLSCMKLSRTTFPSVQPPTAIWRLASRAYIEPNTYPSPKGMVVRGPSPLLEKVNPGCRFYKNSTGTDLDPFPMSQADGKCPFSPRSWRICLLPSSANNHSEWSLVWPESLSPLFEANARWFFHHQFSSGVRQSCPHSLVLQFL